MWEIETVSQMKHLLKIGDDIKSLNNWLLLITVLTSVFDAIMLPVLISLVWVKDVHRNPPFSAVPKPKVYRKYFRKFAS